MSRLRLAALAVLVLVALACSSGETREKPPAELDAAQLRRLGLTRDVPGQVREACAEARRLATVRVICPRLVPDIPLTRIEGLWGSMVSGPGLVYELSFVNAGGFFGRPLKGVEHWITGGGVAAAVEKDVLTDFANEVKGNPKLMRSFSVRGRLAASTASRTIPRVGRTATTWPQLSAWATSSSSRPFTGSATSRRPSRWPLISRRGQTAPEARESARRQSRGLGASSGWAQAGRPTSGHRRRMGCRRS